MSRINTANLRDCVERDMWYQSALRRVTQRGTGQEDQDEGANVEADPPGAASAPNQTPPIPPAVKISSYYVKTN